MRHGVVTDARVVPDDTASGQAKVGGLDNADSSVTVRVYADHSGASTLGNGISGTSQLVVDEAMRVVVGATFTGPGVQELLHSATIAIAGQVPMDRLWHAVPAFPTISEVWLRLMEAYGL